MRSHIDKTKLLAADSELRRLARQLVGDRGHGDDAVQDVWLAVIGGQLEGSERSRGPLRRALTFRVWSIRRAETGRQRREIAAAQAGVVETSPTGLMCVEEARRRVVDAVVSLHEPHRRTVILRFFEGLGPAAIARRMQVPVETVRTRIRRALELLRRELADDLGDSCAGAAPVTTLLLSQNVVLKAAQSVVKGVLSVNTKSKSVVAGVSAIVSALILAVVLFLASSDDATPTSSSSFGDASSVVPQAPQESGLRAPVPTDRFSAALDRSAKEGAPHGLTDVGGFGALRIIVVDSRHERPLPGTPLRLQPMRGPNPFQHYRHFNADERGELYVDEWPAGTTRVSCAFAWEQVRVEAGSTTEFTVRIATGPPLKGVVKAEDGTPIFGAAIMVARIASRYEGHAEATTDVNGEFRTPFFAVDSGHAVSARADGFVASRAIMPRGRGVQREKLEIVLKRPASRLIFEVVDTDGEPLPTAVVVVGEQDYAFERDADGRMSVGAFGVALRTDENGRVTIDSLPVGSTPVWIRHVDYVPWSRELTLGEGDVQRHRVTLESGVRLTGVVRTQDASPIHGAMITMGPLGIATGHLARTDASGAFVLDDVSPGTHKVTASKTGMKEVERVVTIAENEENRIELVLEPLSTIEGSVTDAKGNPLADYWVEADGEHGVAERGLVDDSGKFRITSVEEGKLYRLAVVSGKRVTVFVHPGKVAAGSSAIGIVVPPERLLSGAITGRIVGPGAVPIEDAGVSLNLSRGGAISRMETKTDARGRFTLSDLVTGSYVLAIAAPGLARKGLRVPLAAGQHKDLGIIELPTPGHIEYRVNNPNNLDQKGLGAYLKRVDGKGTHWTNLVRTPALSDPIEPGRYHVSIRSGKLAIQARVVKVAPGETTVVEVEALAGVRWTIAFSKEIAAQNSDVRVRIADASGRPVYDQMVSPDFIADRQLKLRLPRGSFALEVRLDNGELIRKTMRTTDEAASVWIE